MTKPMNGDQLTISRLRPALQAAAGIFRQHNLLSTASDEDRRETLERLFTWWNYIALVALYPDEYALPRDTDLRQRVQEKVLDILEHAQDGELPLFAASQGVSCDWRIGKNGDANSYFILNGGDWLMNVQQHGALTTAEQMANMRLLVRAPDMLSALYDGVQAAQKAVDTWENGELAWAGNYLQAWIVQAEQVIDAIAAHSDRTATKASVLDEPKVPEGFIVALWRSAEDDEAQVALFPADRLDAAQDWLVQMAHSVGYDYAIDYEELRLLEASESFSIDIFDGQPGGQMRLR
jgi:hypothetical protein